MSKLASILALADFIRANKAELMKDIPMYEKALDTLSKAKKEYEKHGMSVVDDPNEGFEDDDAAKWLAEAEGKKEEGGKESAPAEDKGKSYMSHWKPREDYSDKEKADIKKLIDDGYSHREAERMAGAHKGSRDWSKAMKSGVHPSMPSDRMLKELKDLAGEWKDTARQQELADADEWKNPMKHAVGQVHQAHRDATADYQKAYNDFLSSDDVKGKKGMDRVKAVQAWKAKWKQENPDYEQGLDTASAQQSKLATAAETIKQKSKEMDEHIGRGGVSQAPDMTNEEAMQHVGQGKTEEGHIGSVHQQPMPAAVRDPKYVKMLNQEQMERMKRVDSAAATQGKVRVRKKTEG